MTTEGMFSDIPVEIGVVYEGERIRKQTMYVELGGPQVKEKFEILRVKKPEEVNDGEVKVLVPISPKWRWAERSPLESAWRLPEPSSRGTWRRSWNAGSTTSATGLRGSCT